MSPRCPRIIIEVILPRPSCDSIPINTESVAAPNNQVIQLGLRRQRIDIYGPYNSRPLNRFEFCSNGKCLNTVTPKSVEHPRLLLSRTVDYLVLTPVGRRSQPVHIIAEELTPRTHVRMMVGSMVFAVDTAHTIAA
jgi:hypothetical protein